MLTCILRLYIDLEAVCHLRFKEIPSISRPLVVITASWLKLIEHRLASCATTSPILGPIETPAKQSKSTMKIDNSGLFPYISLHFLAQKLHLQVDVAAQSQDLSF